MPVVVEPTKTPLVVNAVNSTLSIPHWGITLRSLFGAALASWPDAQPGQRRSFTVLLKDTPIATILVQQHSCDTSKEETCA